MNEQSKELLEVAKISEQFVKDGQQVAPVIFFHKQGKIGVVEMRGFGDEKSKDNTAGMIRNFRKDCDSVCFVCEGWKKDPKTMERIGEQVMIMIYEGKAQWGFFADIYRNPDRIGPWTSVDHVAGRFAS